LSYRKKIDANQPEIVKNLRKMGFTVELDHDDILVGTQGRTFWYEIKNKDGKNKKQESQEKLERTWRGHYKIVWSLEEILADIKTQLS